MSVYDFTVIAADGSSVDLRSFEGKAMLIVNTASKCGFTPQYDGLEALYQDYKDRDFVVIGFPCNQFGHQEPGTDDDIQEFCRMNHGVTFPVMAKIDVNGKNATPLYDYLKKAKSGLFGGTIKWNFTKFLIDREGNPVERFAPNVEPAEIGPAIDKVLGG